MEGEGMVSLAVRVVTDRRKVKASTKMGWGRVTLPASRRSGRVKKRSPSRPWKVTGSIFPSLVRPESCMRKSMCHDFRRISPSVMPWSPTSSCSFTPSRIAASSAVASWAAFARPASFSRRRALREAGRNRLPTWSARKGGRDSAIAHRREDADETEQRVGVRRGHAHALSDLHDCGEQRVDLEGAARLHVLEHGGLEGPELSRHRVAVLAALADGTADLGPDGRRLGHDGKGVAVQQRVVQDAIAGGAGEGRD